MAPVADVRPLNMSVDEALKYIISMGVVGPTPEMPDGASSCGDARN
jgi:uncharacterized membrane protein